MLQQSQQFDRRQFIIEPDRFARDGGEIRSSVPGRGWERLKDVIEEGWEGELQVSARGYRTERGNPALHLEITGEVPLRCQRCLESYPHRLELARDVVLTPMQDEFGPVDEEDDLVDIIPAASKLDVLDLLEQEIVLSLPMAPRHGPGDCSATDASAVMLATGQPFAALADFGKATRNT